MPPLVQTVRHHLRGRREPRPVLGERLGPQRADLLGLHQRRAPDIREDRVEVVLLFGEERVQEAGRAGVVGLARLAPLEQAAMVKEHVDELPQNVVGGLHELLGDEPVVGVRHELPFRPHRANAIVSVPSARARANAVSTAEPRPSNAIRMSSGPASVATFAATSSASPVSATAGSARLPTITGWTNSTATWRASERAAGLHPHAISRPSRANRSAIRWQTRASRSDSRSKNRREASRRASRSGPTRGTSEADSAGVLTRAPAPAS